MPSTITLAGGCFWCLEAVYELVDGVIAVESGYCNGHVASPSYEQVCTGTTGHAEAVAVTFDETVIPASVILDAFFTLHDPRQLNRQGADIGTQYVKNTGYNRWADSNGIVVLYPQTGTGATNSCWDWWGYTSDDAEQSDYYSRDAIQIKALHGMLSRLGG